MTARGERLTLITGPTRSGKSRFAESLAAQCGRPVVYLATAERHDDDPEWVARLAAHRASRPADWTTIETAHGGRDLPSIVRAASPASVLVVESIGTWLAATVSEFVSRGPGDVDAVALEKTMRERSRDLADALVSSSAQTIVVSEQTGWGTIAPYPSARIFSSVLGRLTTSLARSASRSFLIVSGFAIDLHASATYLDIEENL